MTHIHWFRNDLRLHDQPFQHLLEGKEYFLGVYILSPSDIAYNAYGFRKMSLFRLQWLREALHTLQAQLREKGSELLVLFGKPEEVLPKLVEKHKATLSFEEIPAFEEKIVATNLLSFLATKKVTSWIGGFLVDPACFKKAIPAFTKFRFQVEKQREKFIPKCLSEIKVLPPSPILGAMIKPSKRFIHPHSAVPFIGGEEAGLKRMHDYLMSNNHVKDYKKRRNELIGQDYSSKLSLFLANGSISPRKIMSMIMEYENQFGTNEGVHWLFVELLWRDYFRLCGQWWGDKIFFYSGFSGNNVKPKGYNAKAFSKWKNGTTGDEFVDANMRELLLTGYQSNRGRQNTASFLFHDLGLDWRVGAAWMEHNLLDYDVFSNQGNWQYIAGAGADPKGGRKFDTAWQAQHYDDGGEYRALW
jgi:deoxyribodipyrimidine photo-lyase